MVLFCKHRFTKQYLRENLSDWYYSNWDCETIAYALEDNWLRDDLEKMLRRGYSLELAVDKLVRQGDLKL